MALIFNSTVHGYLIASFKDVLSHYLENLVTPVRNAICDPSPVVRSAAADTFSVLYQVGDCKMRFRAIMEYCKITCSSLSTFLLLYWPKCTSLLWSRNVLLALESPTMLARHQERPRSCKNGGNFWKGPFIITPCACSRWLVTKRWMR